MAISDLILYIVLSGLLLYGIGNAIFKALKHRSSAYHRYIRKRNRRERIALKNNDEQELKQIKLEKIWTSKVTFRHIFSYVSWRGLNDTESEVNAKRYGLLAEIEVEKFELPNVHNVQRYKQFDIVDFFDEIISEYSKVVVDGNYSGMAFFPESVLPYPKQYLLFAINHLISINYSNLPYNILRSFLIKRCINISPSLLPIEYDLNKSVGEQFVKSPK